MGDFFELAGKRESCRSFDKDRSIDNELIKKCISVALLSPSACNSQPWSFVVVNNEEKKLKVVAALRAYNLNRFTEKCPAFIILVEENAVLLKMKDGATHDQKYAAFDMGLMTAHICLAATQLNLGTCIMGSFDEEALKKSLGIESSKNVPVVIAIGYPAKDTIREKLRKNFDDVVKFI